jgi:hypothetical protein
MDILTIKQAADILGVKPRGLAVTVCRSRKARETYGAERLGSFWVLDKAKVLEEDKRRRAWRDDVKRRKG